MATKTTQSERPLLTYRGLPLYTRKSVPPELMSRTRLAESQLLPRDTDSPDAYVRWSDDSKDPYPVYSWHTAKPLPEPPDRDQVRADRDAAEAWAVGVVNNPDAVVFDTETHDKVDPRVCRLAAVDREGNVLLEQLINPQVPITPEASEVNGITDDMVADAPTLEAFAAELQETMQDRYIVCWNAPFDQKAVTGSYAAAGLYVPWWSRRTWHCAMRWHAQHTGVWDSTRGDYRRYQAGGTHDPIDDCHAAWRKIRLMAGAGYSARTIAGIEHTVQEQLDDGAFTGISGDEAARRLLNTLEKLKAEAY